MAKKKTAADYGLTAEQFKELKEIKKLAKQYLIADPGKNVIRSFCQRVAAISHD